VKSLFNQSISFKIQNPIFEFYMRKIQAILTKPYPLEERKQAQLKLAFIFGVVVFIFLFLLKPFGYTQNTVAALLECGLSGLITFATIAFDFLVIFPLFPGYFKEEKWTIGREIILTLVIIATIGTANIVMGSIFWGNTLSIANWLTMIFYTAIIGIVPATISILINQARLLKKYRKEVQGINGTLHAINTALVKEPILIKEAVIEQTTLNEANPFYITIEAENEKDNLRIEAKSFLAASSADNYVKVFYRENDRIKNAMLRTTLKKLEENALPFPELFRCHRTAIINMAAVESLTGSAQGYRLQLMGLPEEIPVSRNLNQVIKEKLAAIHP